MSQISLAEIGSQGHFSDGDWVESRDQDPQGSVRLTQLADVGVGTFRDRSDRWMREDQATRLNCTFLAPDDVLIARMPHPIGRACLVPQDIGRAVTAVDVAILRVDRNSFEPAYVSWMINAPQFHTRVEALQSGTTRKRISRKNLATLTIPRVPLGEQRRIVGFLEEHLSHLDAAQQSLRLAGARQIAWTKSRLQQLIWDESFPRTTVTQVLREPMRNGRSDRASDDPSAVRTLTLTAVTQGDFSLRNTKLTTTTRDRAAGLWLEPGDLFVQRSNTPELVGTSARYDGPREWAIFPDLLIRLRPDEALVDSKFLVAALQSERAHRAMRARAKGLAGSMPKIDQRAVGETIVPIPSMDQQHRIVAQLEGEREVRNRLNEATAAAVRRGEALRRAVLAAAFEGKLRGRHTDAEVIEELVEA